MVGDSSSQNALGTLTSGLAWSRADVKVSWSSRKTYGRTAFAMLHFVFREDSRSHPFRVLHFVFREDS